MRGSSTPRRLRVTGSPAFAGDDSGELASVRRSIFTGNAVMAFSKLAHERHANGRTGMDLGIKGRRAIVTGGSSGIGFETARQLLEEGVRVLITGRDATKLKQARDALAKRTDEDVHAVVADMTKEA